jgi:3-isopropylmalate/(R)-2-methylmalate dehydratase large subunit
MGMTIAEKIMARAAGLDRVEAGQFVDAKVDRVIAHEEFYRIHTSVTMHGMPEIPRIFDLDRFHVVLEHFQPAIDEIQAERAIKMRKLAKHYGLKHFRDSLAGVLHRVVIEDYVVPGELALGSDSHSCAWGALNCAGTGMGEHELAFALTFGRLWFQVPESIKVVLEGKWNDSITGKDVALWLAGKFGTTFALYKSIEFTGPAIEDTSMEKRFQLSAHAVELGGKFGLFDYDERTRAFLASRKNLRDQLEAARPVEADPDATYSQEVVIDLGELAPQVARPHNFENVVPVDDVVGTRIDQALVGSCANGHVEDIEAVAAVVRGRSVHPDTRFIVQPSSWAVWRECSHRGLFDTLLDAGVQVISPGCHLCLGMQGRLADGEVCITSTTRNHRGRMGSGEADIYLASPTTVAYSALAGCIEDPRNPKHISRTQAA